MPIVERKEGEPTKTIISAQPVERMSLDERIVRQGVLQAVLQSPALMAYATDLVEYKKMVFALTEEAINFVWKR